MNAILQYVSQERFFVFSPPQHINCYHNIPFTEADFTAYVKQLTENNELKDITSLHPNGIPDAAVDAAGVDVRVFILPFEVDGKSFVLRHLELNLKEGVQLADFVPFGVNLENGVQQIDQIWGRDAYDDLSIDPGMSLASILV